MAFLASACAVSPASAFLFKGTSDRQAAETLESMAGSYSKGDCAEVIRLADVLFGENPPSAYRQKAYAYLGRCYETQGLTDKAVTLYKLADGLYPADPFFASRLALVYLQSGFYASAVPLFERTLKARSDDIEANAGLARCSAELGFLAKAKIYYSRAVVLGDFKDLSLLKEYAAWMLRKRDWDEADLILDYAVKLAPGDASLRESRGRAAAGRGDYAKAAARMREAVALAPGDRDLVPELALTELLGGNTEAALALVPARSGEEGALALTVRGLALRKKGDAEGARECFKKASGSKGNPFIAAFTSALAEDSAPAGRSADEIP